VQAFSANLDDDKDKDGEQGNNDDDDDDDDDNDDNAGDGKKKAVAAPVVAAEAAATEFAPPVLTLVSVGRLLKRLMRAGIVCQRKDKQMTLGELLHDVAGAQFVSFAERDGAAFTVLTMLNNASPAFAKVLVRDLKRAKLDDKLNGVKLLKDAIQKVSK
jgi:DNA-binding transcriptional ArsR family regulator